MAVSAATGALAIISCAPVISHHFQLPGVVTDLMMGFGLLTFLGVLLGVGFTFLRYRYTRRQLIVLAAVGSVAVGAALFFVPRSIDLSRQHSYYEDARNRLFVHENAEENYESAIAFFKKALERSPGDVPALAWLSIAQSLRHRFFQRSDLKLKDEACKNAHEATRLGADSAEAHLAAARCADLHNDKSKIDAELQRALDLNPTDPMIWLVVAITQQWRGQNDKATANYEQAMKHAPGKDPRIYFYYGHHLFEMGNVDKSRDFLNEAIALRPHSAYFRVVRAVTEISWTGNVQAARSFLDQLPEGVDPDGRVTSARCTLDLYERKFDDALERVQAYKGKKLFSVDAGGLGSQDTIHEAERTILLFKGDPKAKADLEYERPTYEKYLKDNSKSPEFHAALALFNAWTDHKNEAITHAEEAIKNLPDERGPIEKGVLLGVAKAYAWAGEPERAWQQINRFWSIYGGKTGMSKHNFWLDPNWESLRNYPAFREFVSDVHPK
jgi:tetratricopeptide (TPR) repeat protein